METGRPLAEIRDRVLSANAYLGMAPIVEALRGGADVVVTGRVTDTGLTLGPIFHEFGWSPEDWDQVAAGTVAGHIIECGAQASGGNLLKRLALGEGPGRSRAFPIVEASPDGSFVVTKHPGTGGVVSVASVTEQLVYEMGDPQSYITPDGVADFTTIQLRPGGPRPGAGLRHPRRRRARRCSRSPSRTSTATRRSARWSTPGPRRTTRRKRGRPDPPRSGWRTSAWNSSRSSPSSSASTRPTAG